MTPVDNCSVCLNSLTRAVELNCKHQLHLACLIPLIRLQPLASCPLCRGRITSINGEAIPTIADRIEQIAPNRIEEITPTRDLLNSAILKNLPRVIALLQRWSFHDGWLQRASYTVLPLRGTDDIMEALFVAMSPVGRGQVLMDAANRGGTSLFPILMAIEPISPEFMVDVVKNRPESAQHMSPANRGAALLYALNRGHLPQLQIIVNSGPIPAVDLQTVLSNSAAQGARIKAILDKITVATE